MIWLLRTQGRMTLQQILEHCTDGRDAAKAALQELKDGGLVNMTECRSKGRFDSCYYSLTVNGKSTYGTSTVSGKSTYGEAVNGKSAYGEIFENEAFTPQTEKPSPENPPTVTPQVGNPLAVQVIENEDIESTVNGKSTYGDEINDYIYLSNKGSKEGKNREISNTTLNTGEKVENFETEKLTEPPKPLRKKRESKPTVLFRETEFVTLADGPERFKRALINRNPAYELADLDYYYSAVLNWSDQNENRKIDWIATAAGFILGDERKGGFKKPKTNLQNGSSTTINGVDLDRARARAERIAARFGGNL
jgi:hypothetical protein